MGLHFDCFFSECLFKLTSRLFAQWVSPFEPHTVALVLPHTKEISVRLLGLLLEQLTYVAPVQTCAEAPFLDHLVQSLFHLQIL